MPYGYILTEAAWTELQEKIAKLQRDNVRLQRLLERDDKLNNKLLQEENEKLKSDLAGRIDNQIYQSRVNAALKKEVEHLKAHPEVEGLRQAQSALQKKLNTMRKEVATFHERQRQQKATICGLREENEKLKAQTEPKMIEPGYYLYS